MSEITYAYYEKMKAIFARNSSALPEMPADAANIVLVQTAEGRTYEIESANQKVILTQKINELTAVFGNQTYQTQHAPKTEHEDEGYDLWAGITDRSFVFNPTVSTELSELFLESSQQGMEFYNTTETQMNGQIALPEFSDKMIYASSYRNGVDRETGKEVITYRISSTDNSEKVVIEKLDGKLTVFYGNTSYSAA